MKYLIIKNNEKAIINCLNTTPIDVDDYCLLPQELFKEHCDDLDVINDFQGKKVILNKSKKTARLLAEQEAKAAKDLADQVEKALKETIKQNIKTYKEDAKKIKDENVAILLEKFMADLDLIIQRVLK